MHADRNNAVLSWNLEKYSLIIEMAKSIRSIRSIRYWGDVEGTARLTLLRIWLCVLIEYILNANQTRNEIMNKPIQNLKISTLPRGSSAIGCPIVKTLATLTN